jgi:tRNA threonylcarbamoyladenosine dehydratase
MAVGGCGDQNPPPPRCGIAAVYSAEPVQRPDGGCEVAGSLNCAGYGSAVTVTATFGLVAAGAVVERLLLSAHRASGPP